MPTLFCLELSQAHPCHHAISDDGRLGVFGIVDRNPFGTSGTNASFIGHETELFIVAGKDRHLQGKKESEGVAAAELIVGLMAYWASRHHS